MSLTANSANTVQELAFAVAALQYMPTAPTDPLDEVSRRLERSRERNREHARRTRLRKKEQLQALKSKHKTLQAERAQLQLKLQDRHIASLLLKLSSGVSDPNDPGSPAVAGTPKKDAQRKPLVLTMEINGVKVTFGTKSNINWKTGIYTDANGKRQGLTPSQLEALRYVNSANWVESYILTQPHT